MSTEEKKEKLLNQLDALKIFPNNNLVKQLRKRIKQQLKQLEKQKPKPTISDQERLASANANRSSKLSRYWRYVKLIRDNFPDLTISTIRKQLAKRVQGFETDIPDAVWQNPSP